MRLRAELWFCWFAQMHFATYLIAVQWGHPSSAQAAIELIQKNIKLCQQFWNRKATKERRFSAIVWSEQVYFRKLQKCSTWVPPHM